MEKLVIDKQKLFLPTRWDDINISQFFDIQKIVAKVDGNEYLDDEFFYASLFAIFTNTKPSVYYNMNVADAIKVKTTMSFLLQNVKSDDYKTEFEHKKYKFKVKNFNDFTFGEYIDTQHLANFNDKNNTVRLLSVMIDIYDKKDIKKFRFRDKKLTLTREEKEGIILSMPCTKLKGIQTFFLRGQKQYVTDMVSYMAKQARHQRMKAYLQMGGLIISGLWMRVTRMLPKWKMSLNNRSKIS
jgi:hypothetical protein